MVDVVSIKFKSCGKVYYFDPNGTNPKEGERVVVETANGRELAICSQGVHAVADDRVIQPLQPVIRVATAADLRVLELNKKREAEAFEICKKKIAEHELDMKLVDVECNFDGNKITFFFTSDGRVDFRELVKDLAGVFRSRIELRQIGVRDEAKMLGGLGICGRPFCCSQFLNEFYPVSTKMAKVQNLSLNPKKISGCCGRLMCCLRYEQEAYEDLVKTVPKNGAFVETPDGYGNITQVNLLRQTVKVKLDGDNEQHTYTSKQVAAVPGGRPKDGEAPAHVLNYVPEEEPVEEVVDEWNFAILEDYEDLDKKRERREKQAAEQAEQNEERRSRRSRGGRSRNRRGAKPAGEKPEVKQPEGQEKPAKSAAEKQQGEKKQRGAKAQPKKLQSKQPAAEKQEKPAAQQHKAESEGGEKKANRNNRRRPRHHRPRSEKKPTE